MSKSQGKTAKQKNATSAEAANEEGEPKSKKTCNQGASSSYAEETPESHSGAGLKYSLHGNIFQLKLLMLFLIRGIRLKYFNFRLTTEGEGGKFDDLVFLYQDAPRSDTRYRYLQAKHRQSDDKKITETDLLNEGDGDFSLQKYFRSYRNEIANRGRNVQDCIICTNIGFEQHVLESNDFNLTLIDSNDEILAFEPEPHVGVPARYKFQQTEKLVELFRASSELHQLAKKLLEYANTSKKMTLKVEIFKIYHVALRKEKVIDKNKFHRHFIEQNNLSQNISEFRDIIFKLWSKDNKNAGYSQFANFLKTSTFHCSKNFGISNEVSNKTLDDNVADEEITEFLDKLVFAVDMPNEVRLGNILTKEVGQHFNVRGCDFQSSFILEKLLNWFKEKYSNPILKEAKDKTTTGGYNLFEETRQKMVALRATAFSIDFRANYLPSFFRESFQYHEETITQKAEELEEFLNSPEENKTLQISTKSLRCTTVKILSALDTLPRFKNSDDGYLLIESEHLERNKHMKEWVRGAMNEDKSHQVLIVIGETPVQVGSYEKELMPKDTQLRKKMIFICSEDIGETNDFERDEFGCELLSEKTISNIVSTVVTFQGSNVTIESLVEERNGLNEMMDSSLIEEILFHQRKVIIPAFDANEFEKSLWIDRFLLPPQISFDENTLNQLSKELKYRTEALKEKFHFLPEINHIDWLMENENEKCKILEKVQDLLKKNESNKISGHKALIIPTISEKKLVDQSTAIITGVAGSGKSTILSRHYEHVKKNNSNVWVIKINLINHSKYLSELKIPAGGSEEASTSTAIDILINFPGVTSQSKFARSLLKNRLKHSGGVVLMLDGFDEINFECQTNIICLMKALGNGKTKLDRLIITTRPHWTEKLQKALFQFALNLEHLGKEHQVNYLTNYWQKKTNDGNEEELIKKFANSLVEQVSEALKDKDRTFIGIPLQCRILAECFTSQLETFLSTSENYVELAGLGPNYNIAQLYHMLFSKKRDIFRMEKATGSSDSDLIVNWSMDEFLPTIDAYHLKLAIETIFEEKDADLLFPPRQLTDSQYNEDGKNEKMRQYALQFGLTSANTQNPQKLEFLHRTFAEYMVAEFLYKGFLSEENKHKDQIRDSDGPLRDFMIHHILVESAYEGVRVFLDSMLKEMITTDQTWRGTIAQSINESRPNQLQRFAQHLSFSMVGYLSGGSSATALLTAITEGNLGVFDFILDCLAAIYDRKSVQEIVGKAVQNETLFSFFDCSVEIHLRVVNFLSDAEDSICIKLLNLMKKNFPFADAKFDCNFPQKPYLALILDFMEKHPKNLQKIFSLSELRPYKLLNSNGFFIFDEFYDEELRRFIKLQIKNQYFVDNLNYGAEAMSSQSENWENRSIEKILSILQDLKQEEILETLSETVLTSNPDLYETFYGPCVLEKDQIDKLQVLASNGDMKARSKLKRQFLAAAVVGNEQVCEQMLLILSTGEDFKWLEEMGLIHEAAMNAIKCCRSDMFALILRVVHRHFERQNNSGQEALRQLLISNYINTIQNFGKFMLELLQEATIKEIVKMKVTESEDGSDLLSKVFLFTKSSTETANDFERDLSLLFDHVLSHYSNEQLQRFIQLITSQDQQIEAEGIRHSIWAATVARARSDQSHSIFEKVLKLIANRLNQEDVKNLLLHEENNVVVLYWTALMKGDENIISMCSRFLSQENHNIICRDFGEKAPNITLKLLDQYSEELPPYEKKVQLLNFLVDHAIDARQLLRLVDIIQSPDEGMNTHWEVLFDHLSDKTILKIFLGLSQLNADNEGVVKELLAVDDKQGHSAIIIRAAQSRGEEFVKEICASLSEMSQCEIDEFFKRHAPAKIDEMFFSEKLRFSECDSDFFYNALNFFLNHCNDNQLSEFINIVTTLRHVDGGKNSSIWGSYIDKLANSRENWSADCPRAQACRKLEMFLENVNRKLGGDSVIQLLLHSESQQTGKEFTLIQIVLFYVGTLPDDSSKYTGCWTINNNVLSPDKQIELRRQLAPSTEQFLKDKTAHSFSEHQWIRALYFYLDYSTDQNLSNTFFHTITNQDKPKQTNIWEYLFMNITPEVVDEFSRLLRHFKEKLGQKILKNLSLVKNAKGRLVLGEALRTHGYENNFKNVYAVLSKETRIEVCKILFDDPYLTSQLNVEIGSRSFSDNKNEELLMYFGHVRTVRQVDGRNVSMWAKYIGKFGQRPTMEKFEQFMKFIFDKLGEEYLKELVLDDIGDGESTISHAISNQDQNRIDSILSLLSPPSQTEVRHKAYTTTGLVEQMLAKKGSNYWTIRYLGINSTDGTASNLPDGFNLLASYFLDKFNPAQLKEFIKLVTSLNKVEGKTQSIWADYIENVCSFRAYTNVEEERKKFSESSIDRLLTVVSNKLGAAALVHLLYHYDGSRVVINAMRENNR